MQLSNIHLHFPLIFSTLGQFSCLKKPEARKYIVVEELSAMFLPRQIQYVRWKSEINFVVSSLSQQAPIWARHSLQNLAKCINFTLTSLCFSSSWRLSTKCHQEGDFESNLSWLLAYSVQNSRFPELSLAILCREQHIHCILLSSAVKSNFLRWRHEYARSVALLFWQRHQSHAATRLFTLDTSLRGAGTLEASASENMAALATEMKAPLAFVTGESKWRCFMRQR